MEPDEDPTTDITIAELAAQDADGGYEQFISDEAPDHDPFADYPEQAEEPEQFHALLGIPATVTATLAHNLDVRRQNIWKCWGKSVQVGWIGDSAHQAECSDHNKDAAGVVHAIDPMVTGARAQTIVNEALAHNGDLQYVIHNRVIWSATVDWEARKYTGSNPHTDHVHMSGKHGSAHKNGATCVGYDLAAQASTPSFNVCPAPKPPTPTPSGHKPGSRTLKAANPDMTGEDVAFVQRFIGEAHCGKADGSYGDHTVSGVRWYQNMRGIHVDGEVGPQTWGQMGVRYTG